ncbi:MAG TPA: Ppx/GppA phosphatase family protein [Acidimicrobiales bacterium]|nr:Ppx/GppA phosphatase family protein [Acidimicrobiales bacterium]
MSPPGALAAIDCGTNSTRLLIVDAAGLVRAREMRITRLGEGVDATRTLGPDAIERTMTVLREYSTRMDKEHVRRTRLVATSAVRDARNGEDFLHAASEIIGSVAELLPGGEEGRLSYVGATSGLAPCPGDTVVLDIGGGSTEIVTEDRRDVLAVSMDLGCVRLSERYLRHDPPLADELSNAVDAIRVELERAEKAIPRLTALREGSRLIGLAGTVSTLSALELGLEQYARDRIHHSVLTKQMVGHWCSVLGGEPAGARAMRVGMVDGRQDVIVGGALVLREVMTRLSFSSCLVSESDILDGLIDSMRE